MVREFTDFFSVNFCVCFFAYVIFVRFSNIKDCKAFVVVVVVVVVVINSFIPTKSLFETGCFSISR